VHACRRRARGETKFLRARVRSPPSRAAGVGLGTYSLLYKGQRATAGGVRLHGWMYAAEWYPLCFPFAPSVPVSRTYREWHNRSSAFNGRRVHLNVRHFRSLSGCLSLPKHCMHLLGAVESHRRSIAIVAHSVIVSNCTTSIGICASDGRVDKCLTSHRGSARPPTGSVPTSRVMEGRPQELLSPHLLSGNAQMKLSWHCRVASCCLVHPLLPLAHPGQITMRNFDPGSATAPRNQGSTVCMRAPG
jgi:hypothetical protein